MVEENILVELSSDKLSWLWISFVLWFLIWQKILSHYDRWITQSSTKYFDNFGWWFWVGGRCCGHSCGFVFPSWQRYYLLRRWGPCACFSFLWFSMWVIFAGWLGFWVPRAFFDIRRYVIVRAMGVQCLSFVMLGWGLFWPVHYMYRSCCLLSVESSSSWCTRLTIFVLRYPGLSSDYAVEEGVGVVL